MLRGVAWIAVFVLIPCAQIARAGDGSEWGGSNAEWGAALTDNGCQCSPCDNCHCCRSIYPAMLGDLGGLGGFGGFNFGILVSGFGGPFGSLSRAGAPISVFRGAYKISENESPVPQDRVFLAYNYYHNVRKIADVHRETVGFEKTFLDGAASFGLRVPAIQVTDDVGGADYGDFADLTIPFKFALLTDPQTGSMLSAGMAVTVPTGENATGFVVRGGEAFEVHPTLLQPFVGYHWQRGRQFIHAFHAVMVPTDSDDVTILFNDIAVGYELESGNGVVTAVVPTLELHVNTPLDHRDAQDFPRYRDAVNLTAGTTLILRDRVTCGAAVVSPVTGPHLFDVEAIANLNIFY